MFLSFHCLYITQGLMVGTEATLILHIPWSVV